MTSRACRIALVFAVAFVGSCTSPPTPLTGLSSFRVTITGVNGAAPPSPDAPLPANRGDKDEIWDFTIEARTATGAAAPFDGAVRLSVRPGAVQSVTGAGATGRNIRMSAGQASGQVVVTGVYGPARLWVEDVGYSPAPLGQSPQCADGQDDDGDVLVDFPADPGCAFANDDSEEPGSFAAGVSGPVAYALPRLSDIQGEGATTPYPFESMEVNTAEPQRLIVTRVSSDGFYVTDVSPAEQAKGYNHIFAFNFSTPAKMRVCDRVTHLAGTVNEFFGFTELSFPSYRLDYPIEGQDPCEVPLAVVLDEMTLASDVEMEKLESGLVRIEGYKIAVNFGKEPAIDGKNGIFGADRSSCDLNGDGQVDFDSMDEAGCANRCSEQLGCAEWTSFVARGNYKVFKCPPMQADCATATLQNGGSMMQIQTGAVPGFEPVAHRGEDLAAVTGTLRNFSGGTLNWTIETRCPDDLVCAASGCVAAEVPSDKACVRLRSIDDNDQGTN